ncbi:MAG: chemotaxis protein CheW, partial [Verrucomicrobia bacterium]
MAQTQQFCTYHLAGYFFGIEISKVQEVIRSQAVTPVPLADREIRGLINLRGQIITTIDLRRRMSLPDREAED